MPWSLESHLNRYEPHDRRRLLKCSALYAERFKQRVFGGADHSAATGEEILALTLGKIVEGHDGYVFKDGDILLLYYLCRCCRRTVLGMYQDGHAGAVDAPPPLEDEDEAAPVLTERAAVHFLERRQGLAQFLAFVGTKKLQGKVRAYASGFPLYAQEHWDEDRIARSLRTVPAKVATYRSRLRELLEEFELERVRNSTRHS
jgi:hypothetical protein